MGLAPTVDAQRVLTQLNRIEAAQQHHQENGRTQQRVFRRFAIRGEAFIRPAGRHTHLEEQQEVHLRDASRGGVGFICDHPLAEGSYWVLSVIRQGVVVEDKTIHVRYSRTIEGGCHLTGAMFVASDRTLLLLGVEPQEIDRCSLGEPSPDDSVGDFTLPDHP